MKTTTTLTWGKSLAPLWSEIESSWQWKLWAEKLNLVSSALQAYWELKSRKSLPLFHSERKDHQPSEKIWREMGRSKKEEIHVFLIQVPRGSCEADELWKLMGGMSSRQQLYESSPGGLEKMDTNKSAEKIYVSYKKRFRKNVFFSVSAGVISKDPALTSLLS